MSCPSPTGVELWVLGERYVITPEQVGLSRDLVKMIEAYEPEEQRRVVEAVLYGEARSFTAGQILTTVFKSLDGVDRLRMTTDPTGRTKVDVPR